MSSIYYENYYGQTAEIDLDFVIPRLSEEDRRTLLTHLLKAEAAERVEVETEEDSLGVNGFKIVPFYPNRLDGEIYLEAFPDSESCFELSSINGWYTAEEVEHLILCLAAALVEKRKREEIDDKC